MTKPLIVAWICDYPLEWMDELPESLRGLPKRAPSTWLPVLLEEMATNATVSVHVIVLRKGIRENLSFKRNTTTFHVLKVPAWLRAPSLFRIDTALISRVLKTIKPDLVHAWGTERGEALIASRMGYPFLVTMQGLMSWYKELVRLDVYQRFAANLEPLSLRRSRVVTAESSFAVSYLKSRYPHLTVHQIEHAPNWLFHRIQRSPQTGRIRLLNVATIDARKGTDLLLNGLNVLTSEFEFDATIVTSPRRGMPDHLKRKLSPELWSRISFRADLSSTEVANELSSATISVLPTRADTSPNAVKEAVVAGVPVVASRIGGIPDYVFPGKNGVLFPPGDLGEFIQALRLAMSDPAMRDGCVDRASIMAMRSYLSPKLMSERFSEAYRTTLEQGKP